MQQRRGLLAEPDRSPGVHRVYDDDAVTRLRVVKATQRLGSTLDEVAELLHLGRRRGRDQGLQVRARAELDEVDARLADLAVIRDNLVAAIAMGCDDLDDCAGAACCPVPFECLSPPCAAPSSAAVSSP